MLAAIGILATPLAGHSTASADKAPVGYTVVAEMAYGPGNITLAPTGDVIVSLHRFFGHETRVARVASDGEIHEFAADANLDSVLGLQTDANGVVWLLDNAMRGNGQRRLVGWHAAENRRIADIGLGAVSTPQSFLNDLAVDAHRQTAYIADPAGGGDAAIIVIWY